MRHLLTKFTIAVLIFVGIVAFFLRQHQEGIEKLPELAAQISHEGK